MKNITYYIRSRTQGLVRIRMFSLSEIINRISYRMQNQSEDLDIIITKMIDKLEEESI